HLLPPLLFPLVANSHAQAAKGRKKTIRHLSLTEGPTPTFLLKTTLLSIALDPHSSLHVRRSSLNTTDLSALFDILDKPPHTTNTRAILPCLHGQLCQPALLPLRPDQPACRLLRGPRRCRCRYCCLSHRTVQLHDLCVCGPAPIAPGLDPRACSIRSASIPGLVYYFVSSLGISAPLCRVRSLRAWPAPGPPLRLMPSGPSNPRSASTPKSGSSPAGAHGPTATSTGSDGQDDAGSPNRVSWNHLRQGESHQRIRHGAQQLLRLTGRFPTYNGASQEEGYDASNDHALPTEDDLRAMSRLSHSIARDIHEIRTLQREDPNAHKRKSGGEGSSEQQHLAAARSHAGNSGSPPGRRHRRKTIDFSCHKCHRVDTPEWRPGPDGPSTLCNVCGLIYAKRERKKEESTMPTFGSR
ncbi:hypothetical protein CFIO01_13650, partial [Colletotrichum fioriniae PJ7]